MDGDVATNLFCFHRGNSLDAYARWPRPKAIVSDGAYGVRGFEGDTAGVDGLAEWYRPHLREWDMAALPSTTLWFWNTEIGWATVHPVIQSYGWNYVQTVVWDKGVGHIAGNVNGKTIRQYPVVSEICVLYQRNVVLNTDGGPLGVQDWLRHEWQRSGLRFSKANEACGVTSAATRKYLTKDWLWYWPPGEMVERMAAFANLYGRPTDAPYFSLDGRRPVTAREWDKLRYEWHHVHALTNVWRCGPLHGDERIKGGDGKSAPRSKAKTQNSAMHLNQKPLEFMRRLIGSSTNPGDVVWEPFGGLASASVAAIETGRFACVAEVNEKFQDAALQRVRQEAAPRLPYLELLG
jgi:site-specific DNA-methyltransferase (adenine-specific)